MASQQVLSRQSEQSARPFDRTALRFNQALIITFLVAGFILNLPIFVLFVAAVMAIGTAVPQAALFQRIYSDVLRPAKLLKPDLHTEDATPHRFAQGMGAGVLILALIAFLASSAALGWALSIVVIVLAGINLVFGFCAGCFVYFQLQRLGIIGK
ncbi:MAG: DUF4395 domain-containing protein [Chloroflexi bacterium]|nr:DUF4395 domain-containing protein [Chloroflexota bacterium]MCL5273941.1 DUF4395 domain-containing protein [Chloroflexota bacterium]